MNQLINPSEEFQAHLVAFLFTTRIHGNPNWVYSATWFSKAIAVHSSLFFEMEIYPWTSASFDEHYLNGQKSQLPKQIPYDIGIIELTYYCGLLKYQHSHVISH